MNAVNMNQIHPKLEWNCNESLIVQFLYLVKLCNRLATSVKNEDVDLEETQEFIEEKLVEIWFNCLFHLVNYFITLLCEENTGQIKWFLHPKLKLYKLVL